MPCCAMGTIAHRGRAGLSRPCRRWSGWGRRCATIAVARALLCHRCRRPHTAPLPLATRHAQMRRHWARAASSWPPGAHFFTVIGRGMREGEGALSKAGGGGVAVAEVEEGEAGEGSTARDRRCELVRRCRGGNRERRPGD